MTDEATPIYEHNVVNKGIDPALLAALSGNRNGGMFGGNGGNDSLWPLLFLFGRGMGTWGGDGQGCSHHGGCGTCCDPTTPKDVAHQLSSFQTWASENGALLQQAICGIDKSICCSTRDIMQSVNALTPQMYQSFSTLTQGMNSGFASAALGNCQSTAAIQHALCEGFAAASRQSSHEIAGLSRDQQVGFSAQALASTRDILETKNSMEKSVHLLSDLTSHSFNHLQGQADRIALQNSIQSQAQNNALNLQIMTNASAAQLAACEIKNQLAACCCEMKHAVHEDGQITRALITDNEMSALRARLTDTKELLSNANQSILIGQQLQGAVSTIVQHIPKCPPVCCPPVCPPVCPTAPRV